MIVGIIGSGAMGAGIAQVAATAGHNVVVYDNNAAALEKAKKILQLRCKSSRKRARSLLLMTSCSASPLQEK